MDDKDLVVPRISGALVPGVEMAIGPGKGCVVILFHQPQTRIEIAPENAAHVAKELIMQAVQQGAKVIINVPRRPVTDEQREALIARSMHVIRSTQDQNRNARYVAEAVFDAIINGLDG